MKSEIVNVALSRIIQNPMRQTKRYPYDDNKLAALMRSYDVVGVWPGMIGRKQGSEYELAFGHHRWHAAKKKFGTDHRVPLIVEDLSDEQMCQYMGRENLEDYNAVFLVMLEAWEAAKKFKARDAQNPQDLDVATLLGWTRPASSGNTVRMNEVAQACSNTSRLIAGGHMDLDDVGDLSVKAVRELTGRVVAQHEALERIGRERQQPRRNIESAQRTVSRSGRYVASKLRSGTVAPKNIRAEVDLHSFRAAAKDNNQSPLFATFAKPLIDQISKGCNDASIAAKFVEIKKSLGVLEMDEDVNSVKLIALQCGFASERFDKWKTTFTNPKRKVVNLRALEDQRSR